MKSFNRIRKLNQTIGETIDYFGLKNVVVADIATDHGYLAELVSRNDKVSKVIATDISQKCLDKTNELKRKYEISKIETKLGDGLLPIEKVDICVLAGIGGYEIIRIVEEQNNLKNGENKCNIFVFQPSKNADNLRLWLIDKNKEIVRDFIVFSGGRFYPIIVANFNGINNTEKTVFNIHFGKSNSVESVDFLRYLKDLIKQFVFLESIKNTDDNSNDLKTKFEILKLAKELIKISKGE